MSRWRLAALGAAGVGVTYFGLRTAFDDDFDLYNVGAARFVSLEYTHYVWFINERHCQIRNDQYVCMYLSLTKESTLIFVCPKSAKKPFALYLVFKRVTFINQTWVSAVLNNLTVYLKIVLHAAL